MFCFVLFTTTTTRWWWCLLQVLLANNIHNMCIWTYIYILVLPSFLPSFLQSIINKQQMPFRSQLWTPPCRINEVNLNLTIEAPIEQNISFKLSLSATKGILIDLSFLWVWRGVGGRVKGEWVSEWGIEWNPFQNLLWEA
jgi:hypothetical protein